MGKRIRVRTKQPYAAYPGSFVQQNYAEDVVHGYLLWDIGSRDEFSVSFQRLPNPNPFVTVDWQGDVDRTVFHVQENFPPRCRCRIRSQRSLPQNDIDDVVCRLRDEASVIEVTFKSEQKTSRDVVLAGSSEIVKNDLRNVDVLARLVREHHDDPTIDDRTWSDVRELIVKYSQSIMIDGVRNVTWSLRHVQFDNVLAYGEGNAIDFESLSGIVGIFGPNRSGKSSIVGTIMYVLFNGTDRGAIKNVHVVNTRHAHCYGRCVVSVDGVDYVIERQTVKRDAKGGTRGVTSLNVFRVDNGDVTDLVGEQRNDTEKVVRRLIGNPEDFLLTSLSAQDDVKMFITRGSASRHQILARFLDLDMFDRLYDEAKNDLAGAKSMLKMMPERDWTALDVECRARIERCNERLGEYDRKLSVLRERLDEQHRVLASHHDVTPVTPAQVGQQRSNHDAVVRSHTKLTADLVDRRRYGDELVLKIVRIDSALNDHDIDDLKRRVKTHKSLETSVITLKHAYDVDAATLVRYEKSLKLLNDVPCAGRYPMCRFIKDAHQQSLLIDDQRKSVDTSKDRVDQAVVALKSLADGDPAGTLEKIEQLVKLRSKLQLDDSRLRHEISGMESRLETLSADVESSGARLRSLEEALRNDENAELVELRSRIDELQRMLRTIDEERLNIATDRGRAQTTLDKLVTERAQRDDVLYRLRVRELIATAFSRKGVPRGIIRSQLPVINAEVATVLQGIVDFTVEIEIDEDNDALEVYINYGDSRRIVELGSGMEKMISSIALRVALINVSALPKTDMFIIDEGFGSLDDAGIEACNRLLTSLKRYFRLVIVITHVEGVKDAADHVLEVTKHEKDAYVHV